MFKRSQYNKANWRQQRAVMNVLKACDFSINIWHLPCRLLHCWITITCNAVRSHPYYSRNKHSGFEC